MQDKGTRYVTESQQNGVSEIWYISPPNIHFELPCASNNVIEHLKQFMQTSMCVYNKRTGTYDSTNVYNTSLNDYMIPVLVTTKDNIIKV